MNTSLLKDYIKHIYELEVSLYNQRTLQEKIKNEISYYSNLRPETLKALNDTKFSISKLFGTLILYIGIMLVGGLIMIASKNIFGYDLDKIISTNTIIVISIFIILIVLIMEISNYKNKINQNKIIKKNRINKELANKKLEILNQELIRLTSLYEETKTVLNIYYDKNIIFSKYRNLVAISSFHKYLSSGKCICLEGHEGAYSIFENEKFYNEKIGKLDEIIKNLDSIKSNQYMLYSEIKENDREINRISQELNKVSQKTEENPYITTYSSNIEFQNTKFLKWIELFCENLKEKKDNNIENDTNFEEESLDDEVSAKLIAWVVYELITNKELNCSFEGEVSEENTSKEISIIIDKIIESNKEVPYIKSEKLKKESNYFYLEVDDKYNIKIFAGKNGTCIYTNNFQ